MHETRPDEPSHSMQKSLSTLVLTLAVGTSTAFAENWPQFRGPTGQSQSSKKSLPLKWSATENVAWKTELPGQSWSSPIVWGERVFVTTATDGGESCRVLLLDRKSGKILWDKEVFKQVPRRKQARNTDATPTPATDGERVYACFGDGGFAALNFAGELVWTNRDYKFYGEHGLGSSPILYRDLLIMARDGSSEGEDKKPGWQTPWDQSRVIALDAKTGKERWLGKRGLSRISHGVPAIWEHDGKAEVLYHAAVAKGGPLVNALQAALDESIAKLPIPKVMSYAGAGGYYNDQKFVRPAHTLVALHGPRWFARLLRPQNLSGNGSQATT